MIEEVRNSVDIRVNFFDEYYTIPAEMQSETDAFISDVKSLGEQCVDAVEFEQQFAAEGMQERFNSLLTKCIPKQRQLTEEEMKQSEEAVKSYMKDNKGDILKSQAEDAVDMLGVEAQSEVIAKTREKMIDDGTFADYTIASNAIEDAGRVAGFLARKFKKKK